MHKAGWDHGVGVDGRVGCKARALPCAGVDDTCSDGLTIFALFGLFPHVEFDRVDG